MSSPPTPWASADLEKQDLSEQCTSPTDGSTTLADENPEVPGSKGFLQLERLEGGIDKLEGPTKTKLNRQWTDRLKQSMRTPSLPVVLEKFKPAKYDENSQNIERSKF